MIQQPKYEIGQKVWVGHGWYGDKSVVCPDCKGTMVWRVTTPVGESFDVPCSTCYSGYQATGRVSVYGPSVSVREMTVGSVRVDTHDKRPISYMMEETGVGGGQIHCEGAVFQTEQEARTYAEAESAEQVRRAILHNAEQMAGRKKNRSESWKFRKIAELRKEIALLESAIRLAKEAEKEAQ